MSSSIAHPRYQAIQTIMGRTPRRISPPADENGKPLRVSDYFGVNTFDQRQMRERLPKEVFVKIQSTIEDGKRIDPDIAAIVATAVKDWAIERGVTHFCHWFQPMTGLTAEKHDAFLSFDEDQRPIDAFSGGQLIQSEPDASSFPSGGSRSTFEARGYTVWDPSSPMFIMESPNTKTLCIPSAFISYHASALDHKAGLLRSNEALCRKACQLLKTIEGGDPKKVIATVGTEQEYFLIDRAFYNLRPDLIMSGRTLVGEQPSKGQQLDDHYFGTIPARIQAFMGELEYELYRLGVPVKTRHNEVAPSQFECAPIFEDCNLAVDHNHLVMEMMKKVARRHSFEVLLHEKPFAELNGNGKHLNWSMSWSDSGSDSDVNLLDPGKSPKDNLRFLVFLAGVLKGVHKHSALLRSSIANSGNDHRLGANEAPPAIVSVFLGETLTRILDNIEAGSSTDIDKNVEAAMIQLGVNQLPEIRKDNTDRNRTSPFAFTGNKFEFRAVGASATPAKPTTYLNAAVADGLDDLNRKIVEKLSTSKSRESAVLEAIRDTVKETKSIRFEGNNYSDDWVEEAKRRGLPNLRKTPEALEELLKPEVRDLMSKLNIFSEGELQSRYNTRVDRYVQDLLIEVTALQSMIDTQILPASLAYYGDLARSAEAAEEVGSSNPPQKPVLKKLERFLNELQSKRDELDKGVEKVNTLSANTEKARVLSTEVQTTTEEIRAISDHLEGLVADSHWPLPKYREILFIS